MYQEIAKKKGREALYKRITFNLLPHGGEATGYAKAYGDLLLTKAVGQKVEEQPTN